MPIYNATMPTQRHDAESRQIRDDRNDADCLGTQDARQCRRSMHEDDVNNTKMQSQGTKTTMPVFNATMPRWQYATMPRDDAESNTTQTRCMKKTMPIYHATMPTQCHDAESRHEDDVDWLLHDDTNPCWHSDTSPMLTWPLTAAQVAMPRRTAAFIQPASLAARSRDAR